MVLVRNSKIDLKIIVCELEDHVDEFIIQMDQDQGNRSNRLVIIDSFKDQMQKMEGYFGEILRQLTELSSSNAVEGEHMHGAKEGQISTASSSEPFRLKFANLPYYLKSCLTYCCMFPENYPISKGTLIRLLVAEGLVQAQDNQILEDTADENINELVKQGMLQADNEEPYTGTKLIVASSCLKFIRENIMTANAETQPTSSRTARCILASDITKIVDNSHNLHPRSLFVLGNQQTSEENWLKFTGAKFLRVIDLEGTNIKNLPEEVANLIHLTFLSLKRTNISILGKLQALQALDIRWTPINALSDEILKLETSKVKAPQNVQEQQC